MAGPPLPPVAGPPVAGPPLPPVFGPPPAVQVPQPQPPAPAPAPAPPADILQEILQQQQVLRQQQEALQQAHLHAAPVPLPDPVDVPPPAVPLNALQAWQVNWQQQQQQQLRHLQPFMADPAPGPAAPARPRAAVPPAPPGAIRAWEQESDAERSKRHDKYKKMSEASGNDKRAVQQQAVAMMSSVASQERVISYLRSLDLPPGEDDLAKELADTIEAVQSARQDLVDYFEFLGVAHDYGWDAAKIFKDEPDDASKRIQSAVAKAKKKREASDREKKQKKKKSKSSSSSSGSKRSHDSSDKASSSCTSHCCQPVQCYQPYQQKQFRSGQNLPCIRCGDTAHHWRQCPKPATK